MTSHPRLLDAPVIKRRKSPPDSIYVIYDYRLNRSCGVEQTIAAARRVARDWKKQCPDYAPFRIVSYRKDAD